MANDENVGLKVGVTAVAALLIGGFAGAGLADDQQDKVDKLTADLEAKGEPIVIEKIVEVPVDGENLDVVLDYLYDNKDDESENDKLVYFLTDDLDDDELKQVVDRIVFINEAKDKAVAYIKGLDLADELEDEDKTFVSEDLDINGNNIVVDVDEDEVKRVRVQDDDDEVKVTDTDFDDSDAEVVVVVNFEHDGVKLNVPVTVEIKDNKVDDFELGDVVLRN